MLVPDTVPHGSLSWGYGCELLSSWSTLTHCFARYFSHQSFGPITARGNGVFAQYCEHSQLRGNMGPTLILEEFVKYDFSFRETIVTHQGTGPGKVQVNRLFIV